MNNEINHSAAGGGAVMSSQAVDPTRIQVEVVTTSNRASGVEFRARVGTGGSVVRAAPQGGFRSGTLAGALMAAGALPIATAALLSRVADVA
jgi:hypothetical protein